MTNAHGHPRVVAKLLQPELPHAWSVPIVATRVSFDHQVICLGIVHLPRCLPPVPDSVDSKLWCVRACPYHYRGFIGLGIVNAVGDGLRYCIAREIVGIYFVCVLAIACTAIFENTDQFTLLCIHTDHGLTVADEQGFAALDESILLVALRVRSSNEAFDVGF